MENNSLRIAVAGVLVYLASVKVYDLLTHLFLWLNSNLGQAGLFISLGMIFISGIMAVFVMIFLFNYFINSKIPAFSSIFWLLVIVVLLHLSLIGMFQLSETFSGVKNTSDFSGSHYFQLWSKLTEKIFPIVALVYFLWRLNHLKNYSRN